MKLELDRQIGAAAGVVGDGEAGGGERARERPEGAEEGGGGQLELVVAIFEEALPRSLAQPQLEGAVGESR